MGAQGTTTVNFGAFPGATDASVAVVGQAAILAGSLVEAWIRPEATADHSADEHWAEDIVVVAGSIIAGTGFTIFARIGGALATDQFGIPPNPYDTQATRLYGLYTVAWVWN